MAPDDIDRLNDELEGLVADLWRIPTIAGRRSSFRPNVDVYQTDDPPRLTVVCDLAGVDPEEVQLVVRDGLLHLSGERRRTPAEGRMLYFRVEIQMGRFERTIQLPTGVDVDGARATYARGLLTITLPIAEQPPAPVRVSIRVRTIG